MPPLSQQFSRSAGCLEGLHTLDEVEEWFHGCTSRNELTVTPRSLESLPGWSRDPCSGDFVHASGKFFRVTGCEIEDAAGTRRQPIIEQAEIGILGFLVKQFNGLPHLLVQAKVEPGNQGGIQLAPTVQATRSNSSRVHGGASVPYLAYFQHPCSENVIVDTLQSEQGWWFYQKRNRNVVVWTRAEVEVLEDFCWMTLGQLFHFLDTRDLMNMDSRSVLGCIPSVSADPGAEPRATDRDRANALSALASARTTTDMTVRRIGLSQVWGWHQDAVRFHATDGDSPFEIIGVDIEARGREVVQWAQPLLRPLREGRFDLVVRRTLGRLEALFALGGEPGLADIVEFAPTGRPREHGGPPLPELGRTRTLYDQVQSEEGGRFYHAMSRYVVRELMTAAPEAPPGFAWVPIDLVHELLTHPRYFTVEARSLVVCLQRALAGAAQPAVAVGTAPGSRPGPLGTAA